MDVRIIFKQYGKGRDRIVLVDNETGLGFASFGRYDPPFNYLMAAIKRETNTKEK